MHNGVYGDYVLTNSINENDSWFHATYHPTLFKPLIKWNDYVSIKKILKNK